MPHHLGSDRTANWSPVSTAGPPTRVYDDRPNPPGGLPTRPPQASPTAAAPAWGQDRVQAFTEAVLGLHQVMTDRFIPMCSCGSPARHCPIVKAEHDVLGIAMPFEFGPLARPLYYEV